MKDKTILKISIIIMILTLIYMSISLLLLRKKYKETINKIIFEDEYINFVIEDNQKQI